MIDLRDSIKRFSMVLLIAAIYFVAARASLLLALEGTNASPVWPPSGIALAAVLLLGYRVWPAIATGAFLANVWIFASFDNSLPVSMAGGLGTAIGNTLEAVAGGWLITRFANGRNSLDRTMDVIRFVALGAIIATAVSATIGVTTICTISGSWENFPFILLTWWLGDASGILVVTPVILTWSGGLKGEWQLAAIMEAAVMVSLLFVLWALVFLDGNRLPYLFFPLLIWAVIRFGQFESGVMVLLLSALTILSAIRGTGPFVGESVNESLLLVQGYISVISLTVLILSSALAERRRVLEDLESGNERLREEIDERKAVEISLRKSEERFRGLLESAADAMVVVNAGHEIIMVNEQTEKMFGYNRAEILNKPVEILIPPRFDRHRQKAGEYFKKPVRTHMEQGANICAIRKDGSEFPVEITLNQMQTHEGIMVIAAVRDITQRKRYEEQLVYLAEHDGLTGLPNRNLLVDRLKQALLQAGRHHREVAVLFVDLDNFKFINDSLGHDAGDRLLKIVAERLKECVRSADTVARLGGDDFVITLPELADSEAAVQVARKIQATVARPFTMGEHELEISCSIGISIYPRDGKDVDALLKNSDVAMYRAKEQGRNNFQFFTNELNVRAVARMTMERHLRRALERDEFLLHYQPQLDLTTGRINGMEALLRWRSPEMGFTSPADFIPLAEDTGLIVPIGEWVLRKACEQNRAWQDAGLPPLVMAVNVSARQFRQEGLADTVERILQGTGMEARHLELEIVESLLVHDTESAAVLLNRLKELGAKLTMDDFGTGYSSLAYLKRFPFDKLKIDQSFVRDITSNPDSAAIASAMIALAHSLGLRVIAEGIETEGQLTYLRFHGCDDMQGYYFSRPVPAQELEQLLRDDRRLQLASERAAPLEKTLLLVDDEPNVISALERVFMEEGYRILSASSAAQGFDLMAVNRVGVAICDVRMPDMNGIEFLGRVRELYPDTVRISLSGHADLAMVIEAVNRGDIYKFITKPWDEKVLRHRVREAFMHYDLKGVMHEGTRSQQ